MKTITKKMLAVLVAVTMTFQVGVTPFNSMVFADDGSSTVESSQEKETSAPASNSEQPKVSEPAPAANESEQKSEPAEAAADSEQAQANSESKLAAVASKSSYKVTVVYENILQNDGSYTSKTMNYTVSASGMKKVAASTLNSYVKVKSVHANGKTYVYASKWQGAGNGEFSDLIIEGATLTDDTEMRVSPVYDEYQDKTVKVNFTGLMKASGEITSTSDSNTLTRGTSWSFTKKKLDNKVPSVSFDYMGYKYKYTGEWQDESGAVFSSLKVAYSEIDGDVEYTIHPVYTKTPVQILKYKYVDNISTGSGSWENKDSFESFSHTFKAPEGKPHFQFVNWKEVNGDKVTTYNAGDTYTYEVDNKLPAGTVTEVYTYAMWQPSVTVNYHYNGKNIETEKFEDINISEQSLTIDGVEYEGWYDADGNKLDANTVFKAPEITSEKVSRTEYDVYAKKAITIKANSNSWEYDGQEHSDANIEVTEGSLIDGDVIVPTIEGSVKNVTDNEKANVITEIRIMRDGKDVTKYYNIKTEDGSLKVNPREVKISSGSDEKEYDGSALTNESVTIEGKGFVDGEVIMVKAIGEIINVGSVINEIVIEKADSFIEENYSIEENPGTLTVNPVKEKVVVTIKENNGSFKYDGSAKAVEGYAVSIDNEMYSESDFVFKGDAKVKATDAGTYDMQLKAADFENNNKNFANVEFEIVDGTLEISKRDVTLTSADDSKKYDGKALTNDEITIGGEGFAEGEGASYDVTGSQTKVGSSANTFSYTLNDGTKTGNYNIESAEGTLTVEPGPAPVPASGSTSTPDPSVTPAPGAGHTTIMDNAAPQASSASIVDGKAPLAAPAYWALINLLCAIAAALLSLVMMIGYFGKKREEDEVIGEETEIKRKGFARLASLIPAIGGIAAFILTEDMSNAMTMIDKWTVLMVVILAVQICIAAVAKKKEEKIDEEASAIEA